MSSRNVAFMQTVSSVCSTGLIVLYLIALPVGTKLNKVDGFNDGKFIFGTVENHSQGWPTGFQFCLSMMTAVWTIGAFDSCVHMSEEAKNSSYGVPIGVCGSIMFCGILGFFIIICTTTCMNSDVSSVLATGTGFPMAQIIFDSLGKNWAFARDDGLPFSSIVKVVNKNLKVPIRAVWFATFIGLMLGCLCLAGTVAASALFSLGVCGNYLAWCAPIFFRLTSGKDRFVPGRFYLGDLWSKVIGWIACAWVLFIIVLTMIPSGRYVTKEAMNYTVAITGGCWLLSVVFFFVYKYKYYHQSQILSPRICWRNKMLFL
ncbi:unnamed protein product [Ambrosiozyma monospora]|uniref:Unnamed protein product n=1 Tax=Ambrosiozyma monospora TaxID=43982 RepID=A0ACB5SWE1_AMBMO|nr:unnamed protein product [Ambrosiozyma monospora]